MKVVTLTSKMLAPKVAQELGVECIKIDYHPFNDGEGKYILDRDLEGEKICYIQSLYPDQFSSIVHTCFALDLLIQKKVRDIDLVIPYLPFQRQDKPHPDESRNAKVTIAILSKIGYKVKGIWTVDPHSEEALSKYYSFYEGSLDPSRCMANYLREIGINNSLIVAPDKNAVGKMNHIAKALNLPRKKLSKYHDRQGQTHFKESSIETDMKSAVIVDDVVAGGKTLGGTAKILKNSGVEEIHAIVTHALLSEKTKHELTKAGIEDIMSSDSIENKFSKFSLASLIADLFINY